MELADLKYLQAHTGVGLMPVHTQLHIYENAAGARAQVNNGRYTVDMTTDLPVCTISAERLVAAWSACKGEPTLTLTDSNLMVKAGTRRARIGLLDHRAYPRTEPTAKTSHTAPGVAALLKALQPFVATDASKVWATGVCLHNGYAYATNNVILCRVPFPTVLPETVIIPSACFDAIISKGEPVDIGVTQDSATFYFEDDTWVKTLLLSGSWPVKTVDDFIAQLPDNWATPHPDLASVLATAVKLADMRIPIVQFTNHGLALIDEAFQADELDPVPEQGKLNARMAALVFEHATAVQWHVPKQDVHAFKAGEIVGLFGGQR